MGSPFLDSCKIGPFQREIVDRALTMRIDCGQLDPGAVIRPEPGEWRACPSASTRRSWRTELADWRAGRNAVYQLAALTIGARLAVADA
jgi:hypothetical protein